MAAKQHFKVLKLLFIDFFFIKKSAFLRCQENIFDKKKGGG